MKTNYNYDAITNTLTFDKAFKAAASKLGSPEYKIVLALRKDNPDMQIKLVNDNQKKNAGPRLSYNQMKQFISMCHDAVERMATYERVYALSQVQRSPYHYMKAWFLDNYANYSDKPEFDTDGFVIVKTKAQLEAEKKTEQQNMADQSMPIADAQNEADAA